MSYRPYPKYKESGVEWLGPVPEGWEVMRVGYYFNERREKVSDKEYPPLSVTKNGIVPQIETAAKTDDGDNRKKVCKGDFVINSRSDRKGSSGVSEFDGSVSLINTVLSPQEDVHPLFIHHLLRSYPFQEEFYRWGKGIVADLWSTNYSEMRSILLGMPPLSEQIAIAAFLDWETGRIDTLIAEQEKLITLLQEKRQALISHAITKGLNPNAPMKPSSIEWLGNVPEHWEVAPLKFFAQVKTGFAFSSNDFIDEGVPVLRIGDITSEGEIDFSDAKFLPEDCMNRYADVVVHTMDIAMAMTGATIGKAGQYRHQFPALLNQRVCIFRPRLQNRQTFLWYLLNTGFYIEHVRLMAFGGAQPNISDTQLLSCCVPIPPCSEQSDIASFLGQESAKIDGLITEARRAIDLLKERRSALISAAVTGKIDVRNIS